MLVRKVYAGIRTDELAENLTDDDMKDLACLLPDVAGRLNSNGLMRLGYQIDRLELAPDHLSGLRRLGELLVKVADSA